MLSQLEDGGHWPEERLDFWYGRRALELGLTPEFDCEGYAEALESLKRGLVGYGVASSG